MVQTYFDPITNKDIPSGACQCLGRKPPFNSTANGWGGCTCPSTWNVPPHLPEHFGQVFNMRQLATGSSADFSMWFPMFSIESLQMYRMEQLFTTIFTSKCDPRLVYLYYA